MEDAFPMAQRLRAVFRDITGGSSLSGGIAFAHHHDPLDRALQAARNAEKTAKVEYRDQARGHDALCVVALKRSGETLHVGTQWDVNGADPASLFKTLCVVFQPQKGALSSKLAFDALQELPAFEGVHPGPAHESALKRIVKRHHDKQKSWDGPIPPGELASGLNRWAQSIGDNGAAELVRWLLLARFIAGGGER
jgi:CRISPR-associated protein Cmr2